MAEDRFNSVASFTLHSTQFHVLTVSVRHGSTPDALTPAESQVAILAAAGMTNKAIAKVRRTSVRTAANQMASILAKLGLESRFGLAGMPLSGAARPEAPDEPPASARTALQRVALAAVRQHPSEGGEGGRGAQGFWLGLVDGRLRLIEHFQSLDRRYYIARENARGESGDSVSRLHHRERLLAEIIGSGKSEKAAAHELRIAAATASVLLKSALVKLGLRSRVELVMLVKATALTPAPAPDDD
jgi:DNA-binding NarL/FixJ family response regulator